MLGIEISCQDLFDEIFFGVTNMSTAGNWVVCVQWNPPGEVELKHKNSSDIGDWLELFDMKKLKRWMKEWDIEGDEDENVLNEFIFAVIDTHMDYKLRMHHPKDGKPFKINLTFKEED